MIKNANEVVVTACIVITAIYQLGVSLQRKAQ